MDPTRFDTFVLTFASPTRRSFLGIALGGVTAGGVLLHEGDARKHRKKKKGKKSKQPRDGTNNDCPGGAGTCDTNCGRQCDGKACGSDGCGGSCGDCSAGRQCQNGLCTATCARDCTNRACGDDGCGGSCGSCGGNAVCQGGQCTCQRACADKMCGDDGCGGTCGTCLAEREICTQSQCVCATSGGLGPGEICSSAAQCCPYSGEEVCNRGEGSCTTFLAVCRSGSGGRCSGDCDCRGDLVCREGVCRCPGSRPHIGDGLCCAEGLKQCGTRCCLSTQQCLCPPLGQCLCVT